MPVVTLEQAFDSIRLSPAQSSRMATDIPSSTYSSDSSHTLDYEDDGSSVDFEEEDEDDIVEKAESAQAQGDFTTAENEYLRCYERCLEAGNTCNAVRLRVLVRLGSLYHEQQRWENARVRFDQAWTVWNSAKWMADTDRSIHPLSFLRPWSTCCREVGDVSQAEELERRHQTFEKESPEYWKHYRH
ncbi:hypothetical protein DL96DRAFT_1576568 [Flagelloscypha sp. PMI_526]|nr:hypothetical protein DL96DRAFT_1576568 [Flagelloscypha sp. PMI_526]